eukprot:TRINITY_DN20462_c0_g1_i1.p1 TRINITY_DN20462_c0_g1~~TRINITY_DN20462_c0_g1_i1.p1  ORF type:complete len:127 (-),score=1.03 TRINITY_DN20462_c0_g1_i1:274-654(-)
MSSSDGALVLHTRPVGHSTLLVVCHTHSNSSSSRQKPCSTWLTPQRSCRKSKRRPKRGHERGEGKLQPAVHGHELAAQRTEILLQVHEIGTEEVEGLAVEPDQLVVGEGAAARIQWDSQWDQWRGG